MKWRVFAFAFLLVLPAALAQQPAASPDPTTAPQAAAADTGSAPVMPSTRPDPSSSSSSYIIGTNDSLQILVWREPNLSSTLPVRPDGMISLALLGDIPAAGESPMTLSRDISARLKKYVNDPSVTVTVLSVHPKQVFMLGEVQHVGAIPITPEMTPLQAISSAGGLTPFANAKRIYILRGEQGKQKKIPFNYKKALKDGNQQGVSLMAGDTIVVP